MRELHIDRDAAAPAVATESDPEEHPVAAGLRLLRLDSKVGVCLVPARKVRPDCVDSSMRPVEPPTCPGSGQRCVVLSPLP